MYHFNIIITLKMLLASLKLFSHWNSSETYPYFSIMHERKVDDDVKSLTLNAMPGFTMTWKYSTTTGRVKPGAIFKNHQNVFKIEKRKQYHRQNTNYIDTCNAMQAANNFFFFKRNFISSIKNLYWAY